MIEELPSRAARLPVHARARAPRALRPALRPAARGAPPARRRGARAADGALGPRPRRPRAPLRRRRAVRRSRARASSTTCAPRGRPTAALAFDEAAARLRTALELGIERPGRARGGVPRARHREPPRRQRARRARGVHATAPASRASWRTRELLARAAIGYEEACWRPGIADQGAVELLEEAATALGDERSELRVGLLGGLARALDFQGEHERGGDRARRTRSRWRGELDDRAGLATTLMRSYWSRGTSSLEEILDMLTEATDLGEELGDTEILRRGDGLARAGVRRAVRPRRRRGARSRRCARPPSRRRSRSCSTWPSTTARRSRCATGGSRRPRPRRGARTSGAGC